MSLPKYYPWTARFAQTKQNAGDAAHTAGLTRKAGAAEYDVYAEQRKAMEILRMQRFDNKRCAPSCPSAKLTKLKAEIKLDRIEIDLGCPFLRRLASRQPIKKWNGYGSSVVGYRVSRIEYKRVKAEYKPVKRYSHKEVAVCPACDGHGLGDRVARHNGSTYQRRCTRCQGSGRVLRTVRGKGIDQSIEWDGTLTSTWLANGEIDDTEAERIREICRVRHEESDYDTLLKNGVSKEDARTVVQIIKDSL